VTRRPAYRILPALVVTLGIVALLASAYFSQKTPASPPALAMPPVDTPLASPAGPPIVITPVDVSRQQNPPVLVTPIVTAIPTETPIPELTPVVPQSPEQDAARMLLNQQYGVYGFVVLGSDGSIISSYNSTKPFITASTYKLILMADILRRVELGEMSLDDWIYLDPANFEASGGDMYFSWQEAGTWASVDDLLYAVGAWSSNVAALTLLPYTTPEDLRATALSIGMYRTYLFANPYEMPFWPPQPAVDSSAEDVAIARDFIEASALEGPVNLTTPYDMAVYQLGLIRGTVISPWVSEKIVGILSEQAIRDRLPVYIWDVPVVNKPGNLVSVVNDVGILYLPQGPRAVAALSIGVPDDLRATEIIQLLGLIAAGSTDIF
jgi:beta-lactamase class A